MPPNPGHEAEPELGEGEPCDAVGDDQVAGERQLEAAAEDRAVDRRDRRHRRLVDPVEDGVDPLQEVADALKPVGGLQVLPGVVELPQVRARAEPLLERAVDEHRAGLPELDLLERGEHLGADLVHRLVAELDLEDTRFELRPDHRYISSISAA